MADQPIDTTDQQAVTVAQEDREAAAKIYALLGFGPCQHIIDGVEDDVGVVQIVAQRSAEVIASVSSASADWIRTKAFDEAAAECMRAAEASTFADTVSEDERNGHRSACNLLAMNFRVMARRAAPEWLNPEPVPATNQAGEVENHQRKLRAIYDVLHDIHDRCDDEGDRIYLGSTEDRHTLKRQLRHLEKLIPDVLLYPDLSATPTLDYKAAWKALSDPLSWMHEGAQLKQYWGWNLADIANDLIDRAYPGLRSGNALSAAALATQPATSQEGEGLAKYRHLKRGTVYEVLGTAELQAEQLQGDHAALTIYRGEDGKLWARNTAEFQDGRFELIALAATPTPPTLSEDLREALEQAVSVLERLPYGDWPGPMYSGKTVAANALIRRLRAALAQVKAS